MMIQDMGTAMIKQDKSTMMIIKIRDYDNNNDPGGDSLQNNNAAEQ